MSEDWDVDSYRSEFESEDHWQLRKNFMLAHKDKFPEDELVCLAQVFTNIEFMGCRYPDKTMIRVAELAKGVVEKFREQRKNSLKRTFVAASDAASAKVKGQGCKGEEPVSTKRAKVTNKTDPNSKVDEVVLIEEEPTKIEKSSARVPKYGGVKTFNIKKGKQPESSSVSKTAEEIQSASSADEETSSVNSKRPLGDFVLVLGSTDEHPVCIIQRNSSLNKCPIRWNIQKTLEGMFSCQLYMNNQLFATSSGTTVKMSREHTAMVAIAKLREDYYTIRLKSKFFSDSTISPSVLGSGQGETEQLGETNIGRKLMKLMGWEGGGLGVKGQGMKTPVTATLQVRREGLGLNKTQLSSSVGEFKKRAKDYVKTWMMSNSDQDLVFSSDFSSDERKALHEIAISFSLKSKSYGKEPSRQLVISRKVEPYEILKELLKTGGNSDKYELLHPTNT